MNKGIFDPFRLEEIERPDGGVNRRPNQILEIRRGLGILKGGYRLDPDLIDHLKEKGANQIDHEYPGKGVSLLEKQDDHQHRKHQPENIEHQFIDQKGLPERMKKLGTGSGQQVPPAKGEQGGFTGPSTGV